MAKDYPVLSPCKDCIKRFVGCHSTCSDYISWTESGIERPKYVEKSFTMIRSIKKKKRFHKSSG